MTIPAQKAQILMEKIQSLPTDRIADDTAAVTEQLVTLIRDFTIGGKQVHDANIVATMLANRISCLLTHNVKDFERFVGIITIERIDNA